MRQLKITKNYTDRSTRSVDLYLTEVSDIPLLTVDQEIELANKIKAGDSNALNQFVKSNLRFVISIAKNYQGQGLELTDIINEGNIGLIKAAKTFDPLRGFKFITFAVWYIRSSIILAITLHKSQIKKPINSLRGYTLIRKVRVKFEQKFERDPTDEELLELEPEITQQMISDYNSIISIKSIFETTPDSDETLENSLFSEEENPLSNSEDNKIMVEKALSILGVKQRDLIVSYYGIDCDKLTLDQLSQKYGTEREAIRTMINKGIKKIRENKNIMNFIYG